MIESLDKSDTVKREEARLAFKTLAYDVTTQTIFWVD